MVVLSCRAHSWVDATDGARSGDTKDRGCRSRKGMLEDDRKGMLDGADGYINGARSGDSGSISCLITED